MTTTTTVNARWLDGSIQKMENCQIVGDIRWQVVQRSGCMWRDVNVMSMIGGDFNTLKPTDTFDSAPQDVFVNIKGTQECELPPLARSSIDHSSSSYVAFIDHAKGAEVLRHMVDGNDSLTTREELEEEWADCIEMHARYGDAEGVERAAEKMREGEFLVRSTVRDILGKLCFPHSKANERNLNIITVFAKALGPQILDVRDSYNNDSALIHIAAWERDVTMIKVLLDAKANIDITDDSRCTPLHFAVFQSQNACKCGDEECKDNLHSCRVLVKAKASVNAKNNCGNTALLSSIDTGVSELVRLLLDSGADVNIQNNLGSTPLHKTCERRDSKITSMLVLDGADPTIEDVMGYVPQIPKLVPRKVTRAKTFCKVSETIEEDDVDFDGSNRKTSYYWRKTRRNGSYTHATKNRYSNNGRQRSWGSNNSDEGYYWTATSTSWEAKNSSSAGGDKHKNYYGRAASAYCHGDAWW